MRLNLGSGGGEIGGAPHVGGFVAVDIDMAYHPHLVADVESLDMIRDNSADEIFASHIFEHLPYNTTALWEWRRILKPGGLITICIPDILVGYALYRGGFWDLTWFNATIYGCGTLGPFGPYQFHKQALTADMLVDRMKPMFPDAQSTSKIDHRPVYIGEAVVQGHKL